MKIKQSPDDFKVEEIASIAPGQYGDFAFYRLEKRGWTTPDALAAMRRRWQIDQRRLSYGGLKDRHAHTVQYFTIFHGPRRNLEHHDVAVTHLGQVAEAYRSQHIVKNQFRIVLRDVGDVLAARLPKALEEVRDVGLPNYFDDQRFGSVGEGQEFVAKLLVQGRFEDALRQALTAPYEFDNAEQKREKATLLAHWRDWKTCQSKLPRGHARSLVSYLVPHPEDFRGAVARLRPDLRSLYLSAYQSHLWNRMLARWIRRHCLETSLIEVKLQLGSVPMPHELSDVTGREFAELKLPLPSARLKLLADDPRLSVVQEVVDEEGLALKQLQIKGLRELFFSKGERDAWLRPGALTWETADDDRHPGRSKCTLRFDLQRGCYATMVVKRVTA
jgi:tRNA pseudouridine13 synthase